MARRLRYQVASSLDGSNTGPNGEYDWIPMDPDIDFGALFVQFETLLVGAARGNRCRQASCATVFGKPAVVCSTTMTATPKGPRVISRLGDEVRGLKATTAKTSGCSVEAACCEARSTNA